MSSSIKKDLTGKVKSLALQKGADVVGITSVQRLEEGPQGYRPQDLLPEAQSVISIGLRKRAYIMERLPRYIHYPLFGYHLLNSILHQIAHHVTVLLEDEGYYRTLPVTPTGELDKVQILQDGSDPKMRLTGIYSHRHAAVAAGLGEIGLNSLLLSPKFGPRIRVISVITEAPLEIDATLKERLCQPERCGKACISACPPRALHGDGTVDHYKCRFHRNKAEDIDYWKKLAGLSPFERAGTYSAASARGGGLTCALCIKSCPAGFPYFWKGYPPEDTKITERAVKISSLQ